MYRFSNDITYSVNFFEFTHSAQDHKHGMTTAIYAAILSFTNGNVGTLE